MSPSPFGGPPIYQLSFIWSARNTGPKSIASHRGQVIWNGHVLQNLIPTNTHIQEANYNVPLQEGWNVLQFKGTGASDHYGMILDKVSLSASYDPDNRIVNGDFEEPRVTRGREWIGINRGFKGWTVGRAELGYCWHYNTHWRKLGNHNQCIELDSNRNQVYTQRIYISPEEYRKLQIQTMHVTPVPLPPLPPRPSC